MMYCHHQLSVMLLLVVVCTGFPSSYTTVKCGTSGHNIRAATNLDSAAVGMVVIGNQIIATREVSESISVRCWFGVVVIGNQIIATREVSESISVHCWFGVVVIGNQITATREVSESISVHCWFGVVVIGNQIEVSESISVHSWFGVVVIGNQITATREVSGSLFQCIAGLAWLSLATKSPLLVRSRGVYFSA